MQMKDRSLSEGLTDTLDQALARLRAGDSVEACLEAAPEHGRALEPLLRAGDLLYAEAATPLPTEMDDWLAIGAHDFAAIATQMAPRHAKPPQTSRQHARAAAQARQHLDDALDQAIAQLRRAAPAEPSTTTPALEPLVQIAARVQTSASAPLPADLAAWLPQGRHEFLAIAEQLAPRVAQQRKRAAARRLTAQRAAAAVLVVSVMMSAVDSASAQSLPGDTLYPWKRTHENISLALTADPAARSQLLVSYADRRLDEFNRLVESPASADTELLAATLNDLLENVQGAIVADRQAPQVNLKQQTAQLIARTNAVLDQASVAAPSASSVIAAAAPRVNALQEEIAQLPTETAVEPTNTTVPPTDTVVPTSTFDDSGGGGPRSTSTPLPTELPSATLQPTVAGLPSPTPTVAGTTTAQPLPATAVPTNTATPNPITAIPPTVPPTDVPTDTPTETPTVGITPAETPTAGANPDTGTPTLIPGGS